MTTQPQKELVSQQRWELLGNLFPRGVPRLWCPLLTHFRAKGELDAARIHRHLRHLAPYVQGLLVPGSTGEGWEMGDDDLRRLLQVVWEAARPAGLAMLVGVLKHTPADVLRSIDGTLDWISSAAQATAPRESMARLGVVGFTVCPPAGRDLSQTQLQAGLCQMLDRGLPTALYQLPQVTGNEMSPQTVAALAACYPNFYLFKDTSGSDRVATSGENLGGVFLVRGAEGGYVRWTREGGGPYDGLLLSTANVFAPQLDALLALLDQGRESEASELSARIETATQSTFALVQDLPAGNAFTNANKVLDHVMAYGAAAPEHDPPLLYSGVRLPADLITQAMAILRSVELFPDEGYHATHPDTAGS